MLVYRPEWNIPVGMEWNLKHCLQSIPLSLSPSLLIYTFFFCASIISFVPNLSFPVHIMPVSLRPFFLFVIESNEGEKINKQI